MNKKILLSIITVCFLLMGCAKEDVPQQLEQSPSSAAVSNSSTPSEQLKSKLEKYTTNQIIFSQSFTIRDNQNVAFAMAGGDVWYINVSGAQKLKSGIASPSGAQSDAFVLWTIGDTKVFKCEDVSGGSSSMSYAWYVKDGNPVEFPYGDKQNGNFDNVTLVYKNNTITPKLAYADPIVLKWRALTRKI